MCALNPNINVKEPPAHRGSGLPGSAPRRSLTGLQRMVEKDTYCIDVLTQVSAVTRALQSVAVGLLDEHVRHCVAQAAAEGPERADEAIAEATRAIERLVRS